MQIFGKKGIDTEKLNKGENYMKLDLLILNDNNAIIEIKNLLEKKKRKKIIEV